MTVRQRDDAFWNFRNKLRIAQDDDTGYYIGDAVLHDLIQHVLGIKRLHSRFKHQLAAVHPIADVGGLVDIRPCYQIMKPILSGNELNLLKRFECKQISALDGHRTFSLLLSLEIPKKDGLAELALRNQFLSFLKPFFLAENTAAVLLHIQPQVTGFLLSIPKQRTKIAV